MRKSGWAGRSSGARGVTLAIVVTLCAMPGAATPALAAGGGSGPAAPPPQGAAAQALRAQHGLGTPAGTTFVPAHPAHAAAAVPQFNPVARPAPAALWPQAATTTVALGAPPARGTAATAATVWAPAAGLPVQVSAVAATAAASTGTTAAPAVSAVRVQMATHATAQAAGASAVLFGVARNDGAAAAGSVRVRLDYAGFAGAYGGGYGSRLTFVQMPACALTTPSVPACRTTHPVTTVNDTAGQSLTAQVDVGPAGTAVAATSTASGGTGDFKATSLAPSSTWQVNLQTGDFSWSYPLRTPPPIGGAAPMVALAYDSGASDGETAQDNSQPGQLGEGFSLVGGGFVERRYASCADHVGDSSNATDQKSKTGDLCWDGDNAYLSLDGHSSAIIKDSSSGTWRLSNDDGSVVKRLTDTTNGAYQNQYWEVITPDGTQYYFGKNQLPGYASGDRTTNSAWTVPVVGLKTGDPCHSATYTSAACKNMAWRWNLDLVVDPNGNASEYFYDPETNYYAFDSTGTVKGTKTQYTSGGTLAEIDYGSQMPNVYNRRPMQIVFGYADRCTSTNQTTCDANHNGTYWPDTPWDLYCSSSATCTGTGHQAAAFFDTQMLSSVTTQVYEGATPGNVPVDTWTFGHQWLSAEVNSDLFLSSITHTGDVGGTLKLAPVTFGAVGMINRVPGDNYPAMTRYRVQSIVTETGEQIDVDYNAADCGTSRPDPSTDTLPCFQQKWSPGDLGDAPLNSWFYRYTVHEVDVDDGTGGAPPMPTVYKYVGGAAWHYDTDIDLVSNKFKGYSQWRGYGQVHVITGASGDQSETDYTFMRGMDQDPMPDGTFSSASVQDSRNDPSIPDSNADNGFQLEKITYNGLNTADQVSDEIATPWLSPATATTDKQPWGQTLTAQLHNTAQTDGYDTVGGTTRHVRTHDTFDNSTGLVTKEDDHGDLAVAAQEQCTTTTYAQNAGKNILNTASEVKITQGGCGATSPALVSDTRNDYDTLAFGAAPTAGDVTETDVYSANDPGVADHWVQRTRSTYDGYGRVLTVKDALGRSSTTGYTSAYGAGRATTETTVTDPLGHRTVTDVDPAWGAATQVTDPNGELTTYTYDPLGRDTATWLPGQSKAGGDPATYKYTYTQSATLPSTVTTQKLFNAASKLYTTTVEIYDSLLRPRQTQAPAEGISGGTEVSDTLYDTRGNAVIQNGPYPVSAATSTTLVSITEPEVPNEVATVFDGANRVLEKDFDSFGALQWKTTYAYPAPGSVTEVPPAGGTIATTVTDAQGHISEVDQYHSKTAPTGVFDTTAYTYDSSGQLTRIVDNAGNTWTHTYDLLGRDISSTTPDTGTTASVYDDLGQLTSVTSGNGKTLSFVYDALGRKTLEYDTTGGAAETAADETAAWTYDTPAVGQPSTATSFVGGTGGEAYKRTVNSYDPAYHPTSVTYNVPSNSVTGSLSGNYTFTYAYNPDGSVSSVGFPAAGGLPAETVFSGYDNLDSAYSLFGTSDYVEQSVYTADGSPAEIDLGTSQSAQWSRMLSTYDPATLRLATSRVQEEVNNWTNSANIGYTYDDSGNVTKISDPVAGDTQCYRYDYDSRLTAAWAQSSATCPGAAPGASGIGGPAPYQQTFTYDTAGLGTIAENDLITPSATTDTAVTYLDGGSTAPHAATTVAATTGGTTTTTGQTWTAAGQLATATTGATTLAYHWTTTGQLASISNGSTTTASYRYDPDGMLLVRKDGGTATLYLPGEELTANGTTVDATRYYVHGGQIVAVRTSSGVTWLVADPHGTDNIEINSSSQNLTQRRFLPFGAPRGAAPATWPGDKGFVGGSTDTGTGLTNLGAREYSPTAATFVSPDPLLEPLNPQDLDPYTYSTNNPATNSDPSGKMFVGGSGCIGGCYVAPPTRSSGYRPPVPYVNYYVPPPSLFYWPPAPPPKPRPIVRPARPPAPPQVPCNSRVGALNGSCTPPPMPKSPTDPFSKWIGKAIGTAAHWVVQNRTTLANIGAIGACVFGGPAVCIAAQAFAYGVRAVSRVQKEGFGNSLKENLVDLGVSIGTTSLGLGASESMTEENGEIDAKIAAGERTLFPKHSENEIRMVNSFTSIPDISFTILDYVTSHKH